MDKSPLHKLPGELRNRIYRLALVQDDSIEVIRLENRMIVASGSCANVKDALHLLFTCKQVREEALPIFVAENHFEFHTWILKAFWGNEDCATRDTTAIRILVSECLLSLGTQARQIRQVTLNLFRWLAWCGLNSWIPGAIVRAMKELQPLFAGTAAVPEVRIKFEWSDTGRLDGDLFASPEFPLVFTSGKTAREAVAEAFQDEETLVKRSTPDPGERSYMWIPVEDREKDLRHSRKQAELWIEEPGVDTWFLNGL